MKINIKKSANQEPDTSTSTHHSSPKCTIYYAYYFIDLEGNDKS